MYFYRNIFLILLVYILLSICFYLYRKTNNLLGSNISFENFFETDKNERTETLFKNLDIRLEKNSNDKLNDYVKYFNSSLYESKNVTKNVVFCDPRGSGYGNRLYTFLSCFVVALLTDGLVILTAWHETRDFIDLPFNPFFETNLTNDLNPNFEREKIYGFGVPYAWKATKDLNSIMNYQIPENFTRFQYGGYENLFMVLCSNPKHYEKLIFYNLVKNETVIKSIQTIKNQNSTLVERNHNLFMIGFEVGANLLNKIIITKPGIQEIINHYIRSNFIDNFVIGIQLRTIYLDIEIDIMRFLLCALHIENEYLKNIKNKAKPVKWYISSDSEEVIKKIGLLFPEKTLYGNGSILHVADDSQGYYRTLIDVEMLSKCDELIHTGGSTFGFVSAMKSFKVPYFVDGKSKLIKCSRTSLGTSSQLSTGEAVFKR